MIKQAFLLGNHIQSLGIARQLSAIGVRVVLFTESKISIARFSNAVAKSYKFKSLEHLKQILTDVAPREHTMLIPTNDKMIDFLEKYRSSLEGVFHVGLPDSKTVEIFYDKQESYRFAKEYGIACPDTHYPQTISDAEHVSGRLAYPVILKPRIMHTFHKKFGVKAYKCDNAGELLEKAKKIDEKFGVDGVVIQEYLDGGAETLYSYGVYAVNGVPVVSLMANRIRQNPMTFGNSTTFAKVCRIPQIKEQAEKILEITGYTGVAEIEFMYDRKTDTYKFIEINTRFWKWHTLSNRLGFGFASAWVHSLNSVEVPQPQWNENAAWVERLTDSWVISKEVLKGRLKLKQVVESYKADKEYAVFTWQDFAPFIMYLILTPILYFKRH